MKVSHKMIAPLVGVTLLVALVVTTTLWAFKQTEVGAAARQHAAVVLASADELLSKLRDAETGQRGYLITGDAAFLEPYLAVRDDINGRLKILQSLTSVAAARKHLEAVTPLVAAKLAQMSNAIELRRNHDLTATQAVLESGQGKQLMDSIRGEMNGFVAIETA